MKRETLLWSIARHVTFLSLLLVASIATPIDAQPVQHDELLIDEVDVGVPLVSPPSRQSVRETRETSIESSSNPKPASMKHELVTTHANDLLEITNEKLRNEVEWLAREYRDSERMNTVYALAVAGGIALIFFILGFWVGSRRPNRDRYL